MGSGLSRVRRASTTKAVAAVAAISSVGTVHIRRSTLASPDAARLIAALNSELTETFPESGATHFSLSDTQVAAGDGAFLIAWLDGAAIGCGAVRRLDETTAEIKRMYVDPSVRGRGIGRALVEALEHEARLIGVTKIVLETGTRLASAIKLYEAAGTPTSRSSANISGRRKRACVSVNRWRNRNYSLCPWMQRGFSTGADAVCFPYRSRSFSFRCAAQRFSRSRISSAGAMPNRFSDRIMARTLT